MNNKAKPGLINKNRKHSPYSSLKPAQILVLGFLILVIIGSVLLSLPIASQNNQSISYLDALFTATSAVCVTGLVVVNTFAQWSLFGKIIIISLIQIGGIGFMTLVSMLFVVMGRKTTLKDRLLMQEALGQNQMSGIVQFTQKVIKGTFMIEGLGAVLLSIKFIPEFGALKGIWYSIFHSISAFCNAGFDIIGDSNLAPYVHDATINFTIMGLIIIGGLGFGVCMEIIREIQYKLKKKISWKQMFRKLSLHSKLVIVITTSLIVIGFIFFFFAEFNNTLTMGNSTFKNKMLSSLFQSVSPRTAGFSTMDLTALKDSSKFMTIVLMFIGGSPAGTAGGIKTIAVGVLVLTAISTVKGKGSTEVFGRRITIKTILRSLTVIMFSLAVVVVVTIILSFTENAQFLDLFFEAMSGFATVGLTLDITANLSFVGKIIMIINMFVGRLGPVTMALAIMIKQDSHQSPIKYPEEKVIV